MCRLAGFKYRKVVRRLKTLALYLTVKLGLCFFENSLVLAGCSLVVIRYSLALAGHLLVLARCSLVVAGCPSIVTGYSLVLARYPSIVAGYLLVLAAKIVSTFAKLASALPKVAKIFPPTTTPKTHGKHIHPCFLMRAS